MTDPRSSARTSLLGAPSRRRLLGMLAVLPLLGGAGPLAGLRLAQADPPPPSPPFPDGAELLIAGPDGGVLDRWCRVLAPALGRSLPSGTAVRLVREGGADGVTGANQFEVRALHDGSCALLTPGEAAIAWLAGDPRAQFDVGGWVPVLAGAAPSLLVGRLPHGALRARRPLRVAVARIDSPDLAALLGVELLGSPALAVPGIDTAALPAAFRRGTVDVGLLRGEGGSARLHDLLAAGAVPLCSLGAAEEARPPVRDPAYPELPHFEELYQVVHGTAPAGPLYRGWTAAAAASRLVFALVLGRLTPADMVALWRRAAADATEPADMRRIAANAGLRLLVGPASGTGTASIAADMAALLALRQWLSRRPDWHPA